MNVSFVKYHGTGNDFVLIDNRDAKLNPRQGQVRKICNRRIGIGADGLILLQEKDGYDFEMIYYNADGLPGTMCGNGGRCVAAFARELGIVDKTAEFMACDGHHRAEIYRDKIKLSMADVGQPERVGDDFFVDTGSPHYVIFTDRTDELDVFSKGREVRYNERFSKEGTNVNFVEALPGKIRMRTYERGVEDETLSCGTGVCAAAICSSIRHPDEFAGRCDVQTRGGMLKVYFCVNGSGIFSDVWLEGPAVRVFSGIIKL